MTLSVVMPVYNVDCAYLEKCLRSLLSQSVEGGYEVIIVDDGSNNGCSKVAARFSAEQENFAYIYKDNEGTSVARNLGLSHISGEYVLFVDADDYLSPNIFQTLADTIRERGSDVLFFGYATAYANREVSRVIKGHDLDSRIWNRRSLELSVLKGEPLIGPVDVGAPWGKLIRAEVIKGNNIRYVPGLKKGQDTVFSLELFEAAASFSYVPILGYHYRVSEKSVSRRFQSDIVGTMEKTLSEFRRFCEVHEKDEEFFHAVDRKYYKVLLGEYMEIYFLHKDNPLYGTDRLRKEFLKLISREPYKSAIESLNNSSSSIDGLVRDLIKSHRIRALFDLKRFDFLFRGMVVKRYR